MTNGLLLWVDDEIEQLKGHIMFLEKKGYEIVTVSNGIDALDLCRQRNFDLVLLDEQMPGISGLETLRRYTARTMRLIVSEQNLPLLGTQYTYDEYQQFYERELAPMQVSKDNLLINPEAVDAPDIEDELPAKPAEQPVPATQKKQQKVLDFDDDFW